MIPTWRKAWGEGDFPFLYVQLPQYNSKAPEHPYFDQVPWAEVRDAQLKTLSVPNTAMVVTIDIAGDPVEIHPKNKQEVGARLALAARGTVYREPVVYSGPIYSGMTIDGGTATVTFTHAENGLSTKDGSALVGFAIAGEDRIFVPAEATIIDGKIKVHSDKVTKPVSVRFGWDDTPAVNLFNKEGLPASPFRTDDWPMSITNKS